jgi:hypothetical protein
VNAICAPTYVTLVLRSVKGMMLTTASNAHKHAAAVLKSVEGWCSNNQAISNFLVRKEKEDEYKKEF